MKDFQRAYDIVIKMLSSYPRTIFEVRKKLRTKFFSEEIISKVIKHCQEEKILSDERYAEMWLENQLKYRPMGRILCCKKMLGRGLKIELVNKTLENYFDEEKEVSLAYNLASGKIIELRHKSLTKKQITPKIGQYLNRKGFPENIIWNVLEKMDLLN